MQHRTLIHTLRLDSRVDGRDSRLDVCDSRLDVCDSRLDGCDSRLDACDSRLDGYVHQDLSHNEHMSKS